MVVGNPVAVLVTIPLYAPTPTAEPTAKVMVAEVPVTAAGATVAAIPEGNPVTARFTVPANPPRRATLAVIVPFAPCAMDTVLGVSEVVYPAGPVTLRAMVAEPDVVPDVPRTVTVYVPATAVDAAVSVSVLAVADPPSGVGANAAVTPAGRFSAVSATSPMNPPTRATVTAV